jgi:hypothetical protein
MLLAILQSASMTFSPVIPADLKQKTLLKPELDTRRFRA